MEKGFEKKLNQLEEGSSMKKEDIFELALEQEPISFTPIGGDLEKIGIDRREQIILIPNEQQEVLETIGFLFPKKGRRLTAK